MYKSLRPALCCALITTVGLMLATGAVLPARAQVVELQFDTLPSAQGWTYTTSGPPESDIFSVDGTALHQNSIGTGLGAGGSAFQYYILFNVVDPTKPFTLDIRARVLESETADSGGFSFGVFTGSEIFEIFMDTSTIKDSFQTAVSTPISPTVFHDYRLEGTPGVGYRFFIDGSLAASGPSHPVVLPNQLFIGDGTSGGNARADVTFYRFSQSQDADGDGVSDAQDNCPDSIVTPTVVIGGCDSGVPNTIFPNGCTIADRIQQCGVGAQNHGQFVSCVAHFTNELRQAGVITGQQRGAVRSCAAQ
jgi:hypothetical protein